MEESEHDGADNEGMEGGNAADACPPGGGG